MKELNCYAETNDGLVRLQVREENHEEHGDVSIWENDDLRDDICTYAELIIEYGEYYYDTKEDFKKDNKKTFSEYFDFKQKKEEITCPFCYEDGFDLIGLKNHLLTYCNIFNKTENL